MTDHPQPFTQTATQPIVPPSEPVRFTPEEAQFILNCMATQFRSGISGDREGVRAAVAWADSIEAKLKAMQKENPAG